MAYNEQKNKIQSRVNQTIRSLFKEYKVVSGSNAPAVGNTTVPLGTPVNEEVPNGIPIDKEGAPSKQARERTSFWDWALFPYNAYHRHDHVHIHIDNEGSRSVRAAVPVQRTERAQREDGGTSERKAKSEPSVLAILFVVTLLCFCVGVVAWLCCSYVPGAYGRLAERMSSRFSRGMKGVRYLKHHLMNLLEISVVCLGMVSGTALALSASALIGEAFGVSMAVLTGVGAWAVGLLALFVGLSALVSGALAVNAFVGLKHWWSGPMSWGSDASRMHSNFHEKLTCRLELPDNRKCCMKEVQDALGCESMPSLSGDGDPGKAFLEDLTVQVLRAGYKLAKQESFIYPNISSYFHSAYKYCKMGELNADDEQNLSLEQHMERLRSMQEWLSSISILPNDLGVDFDLLTFIKLHRICLGWVLQETSATSAVRDSVHSDQLRPNRTEIQTEVEAVGAPVVGERVSVGAPVVRGRVSVGAPVVGERVSVGLHSSY